MTYKTQLGELHHADCIDVMEKIIEPHSVDLIMTDPPYGQNYELGRSKDRDKEETKIANDTMYQTMLLLDNVLPLFNRVSKEDSEWFIFCAGFTKDKAKRRVISKVEEYAEIKNEIIWDKEHYGFGDDFRYQYETILQCVKGKGLKRASRQGNVVKCKRVRVDKNDHPNRKPFALIKLLIMLKQPTLVLDPFMGSGVTAKVCERLQIKWIGCEKSDHWYLFAKNGIDKEKCEGKLFNMEQLSLGGDGNESKK